MQYITDYEKLQRNVVSYLFITLVRIEQLSLSSKETYQNAFEQNGNQIFHIGSKNNYTQIELIGEPESCVNFRA